MGYFENLFKHIRNKDIEVLAIGEKFPWKGYNDLGDHVSVALNEASFDIVISMSNLSEQELSAIGVEQFEVFVAASEVVPFIVLKFGDVFKVDVTINIHKMDELFRELWFNSDNDSVRIFLLEGSNATLKCIRTFSFDQMESIRNVCKKQLTTTKENVDSEIDMIYQQVSLEQIMEIAPVRFVVPSAMKI